MVREYSEKSYKSSKFNFQMLVEEKQSNNLYSELFSRKLPGNVLLSAYYTPITVNELALELGVSTIYMKDEIDLLVKYNLLKAVSENKYQTNMIIFTKAYEKEMFAQADTFCVLEMKKILLLLKELLPEIRKIGFHGNNLSDNQLLWSLYVQSIFNIERENNRDCKDSPVLYSSTKGIVYASDYDGNKYPIHGMSDYWEVENKYIVSFINFGILNNKWDNWENSVNGIKQDIKNTVENGKPTEFPIYTKEEFDSIKLILKDIFKSMAAFFDKFSQNACEVMKSHAPASVHDQINIIINKKLPFIVMGYMGAIGLKSEILEMPEKDHKATVTGFIL